MEKRRKERARKERQEAKAERRERRKAEREERRDSGETADGLETPPADSISVDT
jgi:hypothetical protein